MTSIEKNIYVISIHDAQNRMQSYTIAAPSLSAATAEAQRLAGVDGSVDPATTQKMGRIDSEV